VVTGIDLVSIHGSPNSENGFKEMQITNRDNILFWTNNNLMFQKTTVNIIFLFRLRHFHSTSETWFAMHKVWSFSLQTNRNYIIVILTEKSIIKWFVRWEVTVQKGFIGLPKSMKNTNYAYTYKLLPSTEMDVKRIRSKSTVVNHKSTKLNTMLLNTVYILCYNKMK
jgi:hypothetical protein